MMGADGGKGEPSLLFISSDKYPPFRVDVRILFAKELASRGYRIDWILQSEQPCTADHVESWGGGRAWVARIPCATTCACLAWRAETGMTSSR